MTNTERFYNRIKWYFDAVGQITAEYNAAAEYADRFKGSEGGKELADKARATKDAALKAERDTTGKAIREITASMKEKATTRKIIAPTAEQLAILQTLKMRQSVTKEEIRQAENSLEDCPLALSVLDEIAHANNLTYTGKRKAMTTDFVLNRVDCLEKNALAMIRGDNARFNRPPTDLNDCLTRWGAFSYALQVDEWGGQHAVVDQDAITSFSAIVDGAGSQ